MEDNGFRLEFGDLCTDAARISLSKKSEKICGDTVDVTGHGRRQVLVLSDGMGSGVKANILATLTSKMLSKMIAEDVPVREAVETVGRTLPVCSVRGMAYATFTILSAEADLIHLIQFDNPDAILIRDGLVFEYPINVYRIGDMEIHESKLRLRDGDMLIMMSDGVTNAGMGKTTNGGWSREEVSRFCGSTYYHGIGVQEMAVRIAYAGLALNLEETDDDLTVFAVRVRKKQIVNLMIGPQADPREDVEYMRGFFEAEGLHVLCGGTTMNVAARYLCRSASVVSGSESEDIPAYFQLEGCDLVTEGMITLNRLIDFLEYFEQYPLDSFRDLSKKNAVMLLWKLLFVEATHINVYFGNSVNREQSGSVCFERTKEETVKLLIDRLKQAGKEVRIAHRSE